MNENFKNFVKKEKGVIEVVREKEEQEKQEREKRKELEKLKFFQERKAALEEKRKKLKEKNPILEEMNEIKYIDFLRGEIETREGVKLVKNLIVNQENGTVSCGHMAENDLLGRVFVRKSDVVLAPKKIKEGGTEIIKELAFPSLVEFYKDYQKEEECKLGKYAKTKLKDVLKENENIKIKDINFFTGVGTTLDFNYGVDGWVEIIDSEDNKIQIYYDMKSDFRTDRFEERDIKLSPYADLPLFILEKEGNVDTKNSFNIKTINDFLIRVKNIYFAKRSLMLKDSSKIITPKIIKE